MTLFNIHKVLSSIFKNIKKTKWACNFVRGKWQKRTRQNVGIIMKLFIFYKENMNLPFAMDVVRARRRRRRGGGKHIVMYFLSLAVYNNLCQFNGKNVFKWRHGLRNYRFVLVHCNHESNILIVRPAMMSSFVRMHCRSV
jgi:hypothetical protein